MQKPKIYYDGSCHVCSREMGHYQKIASHVFEWVDIANSLFDANQEGLDPKKVQNKMHVRLENGELRTGVDAFLEIWKRLPSYRWLVPTLGNPLVYPFARLGYFLFARGIRPLLPKRQYCPHIRCQSPSKLER